MSFLARLADRLATAFVTETVTDDGTRILMGLDPSCHGMDMVLVSTAVPLPRDHVPGDHVARDHDGRCADGWRPDGWDLDGSDRDLPVR